MARYQASVTSAAALAVNTAFAALVPGASAAFRLRRLTLGTIAGTSAPTSQQLLVGINRGTARGTATTTATGVAMDPRAPASAITGLDTAWSTAPTLAASDVFQLPFNSQAGVDLPWDYIEELWSTTGTANPICFVNRANAVPSGMQIVANFEWEE